MADVVCYAAAWRLRGSALSVDVFNLQLRPPDLSSGALSVSRPFLSGYSEQDVPLLHVTTRVSLFQTPSLLSGKRGSNPRPLAWEANALPLSYSRLLSGKVIKILSETVFCVLVFPVSISRISSSEPPTRVELVTCSLRVSRSTA